MRMSNPDEIEGSVLHNIKQIMQVGLSESTIALFCLPRKWLHVLQIALENPWLSWMFVESQQMSADDHNHAQPKMRNLTTVR